MQSKRPRFGQTPLGVVYVLDALNILKHRNDEQKPSDFNWTQLLAAGSYYKQRGKQVFAFIPRTREWNPCDPNVKRLTEEIGSDFIVRCPPGISDDKFMITFARDLEDEFNKNRMQNSRESIKPVIVRIVTNDLFRDHCEVDKMWVQEHTMKFAFAGGRFVPQTQG